MKIQLNKDWRIESDKYGYRIFHKQKNKNNFGKVVIKDVVVGNYTTFDGMLGGLLNEKLKRSTAVTVKDLKDDIVTIFNDVRKLSPLNEMRRISKNVKK